MYGMHRADILHILADGLPPGVVRTSRKCVSVEQTDEYAELRFEDGETARVDAVIAADGIKSALQLQVADSEQPEYAGYRAYRGLIAREKLAEWDDRTHQVWMGDGKHFMVFPVRSGRLLNYVGFVPTASETVESWSATGDRDELANEFADWDPRVTDLLSRIESCFWWGLYDRRPLSNWVSGRLALLGDAAHPMLPHLGQGANQAIEDGVAVAVLLEGRTSSEVPAALRAYQSLRKPRTDVIQAEARRNGHRYDSRYEDLAQRDSEIREAAIALRRSLYDYDVEQAAQEMRK